MKWNKKTIKSLKSRRKATKRETNEIIEKKKCRQEKIRNANCYIENKEIRK